MIRFEGTSVGPAQLSRAEYETPKAGNWAATQVMSVVDEKLILTQLIAPGLAVTEGMSNETLQLSSKYRPVMVMREPCLGP